MRMKKLSAAVGGAALVLAGMTMVAPAYAGSANCPLGYACLWDSEDYGGFAYQQQYTKAVRSDVNNRANAAKANGNICDTTRFYDNRSMTGKYFVLYSQTKKRFNYQDPYLTNGAGEGPYSRENWENRVSYIWFGGKGCK